jgi:hypothetical protein
VYKKHWIYKNLITTITTRMKTMKKLYAILLAAAVCAAWPALAQTAATPATTNAPAPRPMRPPTRYQGTIASIDSTNMIVTLKGRGTNPGTKVKLTSTTKITKDKEPAQFADVVAGVHVSGSGKKGEDGVWTATTFNVVTKPPAPRTPPAAATPAPGQ